MHSTSIGDYTSAASPSWNSPPSPRASSFPRHAGHGRGAKRVFPGRITPDGKLS